MSRPVALATLSFALSFAQLAACGSSEEAPTERSERELLVEQLDSMLTDKESMLLPRVPTDGDWSAFPQDPKNPLTDAKVALGRALYYETGLSVADPDLAGAGTWSCGTCHVASASFGADTAMARGIAHGGEGSGIDRGFRADVEPLDVDMAAVQERRTVNIAWTAKVAGWRGDFDSIDGYGPPGSLIEDGYEGTESFVYLGLVGHNFYSEGSLRPPEHSPLADGTYDELLAAAYPEVPASERANPRYVAMALAAFVRSITTSEAPFQQTLRLGDAPDPDAVPLSDEALRGAVLFFGEGRCATCHNGPSLSTPTYHVLGLPLYDPDMEVLGYEPVDEEPAGEGGWGTLGQLWKNEPFNLLGRFASTGDEEDKGAYLVPSVYGAGNENLRGWGHGAVHDSLADFIAHKVGGSDPTVNTTLDPQTLDLIELSPILYSSTQPYLDDQQILDLVAFIEEGLEDTGLEERYGPPSAWSLAGRCSPNADEMSVDDDPDCAVRLY